MSPAKETTVTIAHPPIRCPKCGAPFCRVCPALKARAPLPAPPLGPPLRCPTGKVRDVLRRFPHVPIVGSARPRFAGEVYGDMLGGLELEGGRPLPDDLRVEVVQLSNASKCIPPLTSAELAEALRPFKAVDS